LLAATPAAGQTAQAEDPTREEAPSSLDYEVHRFDGFDYRVQIGGPHGPEFQGSFAVDEARLNLSYRATPNATEGPRSVNLSMQLDGVYEFRDLDGNGRFDLGDELVRFERVDESTRGTVQHVDAPGRIEGFRASYPVGDRGFLAYTSYVAPEVAFLTDGRPVQPMGTEVSVTLGDLDFEGEDTRFAVAWRLESDEVDRKSPREIRVSGDRANLLYTWRANADRDGASLPISTSVVEQHVNRSSGPRTEAVIVHAVPPGDSVQLADGFEVHLPAPDEPGPEFAESLGEPRTFVAGLLAAVVLVGGNAWRKIRESGPATPEAPRFDGE
jgi:hypothetical protein